MSTDEPVTLPSVCEPTSACPTLPVAPTATADARLNTPPDAPADTDAEPGVVADLRAAVDPSLFEPLLTTNEAARHLRLHPKTLERFARDGVVPCRKVGKCWYFRLSALDRWFNNQQTETSQPFLVNERE